MLSWLRRAIFALDRTLRRRQGVFEYVRSRECIFRIQVAAAEGNLRLADGTELSSRDPILMLHLWNENMPTIPEHGPTVAWGRQLDRAIDRSLRELARFLGERHEFDSI